VAAERLAELFVEAITRVLAWVDEHKAYLFLTAAVAAGLVAASAAMGLWGLIELGRLAHAASLAPFAAFGGVERSREAGRFEARPPWACGASSSSTGWPTLWPERRSSPGSPTRERGRRRGSRRWPRGTRGGGSTRGPSTGSSRPL